MFLISDSRGVDQRRFRVLDVDAKGNLYLYKTALLCKNEIIKRLRNGTYSLAEQTELGMIFLFYFYEISINILRKARLTWTPKCFSPHALVFYVLGRLMPSFQDWEFQNVSVLVLRTFPEKCLFQKWNPCLEYTFNEV